jgi:hypothetical protein
MRHVTAYPEPASRRVTLCLGTSLLELEGQILRARKNYNYP